MKPVALLFRYRWFLLAAVILVTLAAGYSFRKLEINPDVFDNLPAEDPVARLFTKVGKQYGGNYTCIIGIEDDDVFRTDVLERLKIICDSLRYVPGIGSITSLINVIDIRDRGWGIEIGSLVDEYNLPATEGELADLKKYVLSKDIYRGLVSRDATLTVVAVRINEGVNKIGIAGSIRRCVDRLGYSGIYYGGTPFVIEAFGSSIRRDLSFIAPISLFLILLVLLAGFRTARGVLLPVVTILVSIAWAFGFMAVAGVEISLISSTIPIILIAIGSAYSIHVINRISETRLISPEEAAITGLRHVAAPVMFTALTTIFGFISFVFGTYLSMIRYFGIFTAAGIAVAVLVSLGMVPPLMAGRRSRVRLTANHRKGYRLAGILGLLNRLSHRYVLLTWLLVSLVFLSFMFRIDRRVDFLEYLPPDNPNRITERLLNRKMGGASPVYLSIRGDILSPEGLALADSISSFVRSNRNVVHTLSVADLFRQMNSVMGEGDRIPDSREKIGNLWFLLEGQEVLYQLINAERNETIIQATFGSSDIDECKAFSDAVSAFIRDLDGDFRIGFSGIPSLLVRVDESIVQSQFRSLGLAMILVFLAVSWMLRSLIKGVLAMAPIAATLVVLYGFMGLAGIPLDIATVLVGSISIGIGIDYSIHVIHHFNRNLLSGMTGEEAAGNTIEVVGRSIVINAAAVSAGFLVLLLSDLVPLARFGILVAVTMITSALGSLTLLPALLKLRKWKPHRVN